MSGPPRDALGAEWDARLERVRLASRAVRGHLPRTAAVAVLRGFTPREFLGSAVAFAAGLPPDRRAAWYGSYSRTIFLAGDPRNLAGRHPCDHLSDDGSIGWYAPAPMADREGLRRLLRPFHGPLGVTGPTEEEIPVGEGGGVARLEVPVADLPVEDYLVNVNHLLAEAAMDGLFTGIGRLLVRHLPRDPDERAIRWDRIRVSPDDRSAGTFRAHAYLALSP
ncbi:DUF6182 family protein [Actinomadura litoris]|uniref:Uncharacterized protein n=1 Tax=Actinomadura litoris TaxID=2678616 RepID=A0A7K1L460_9ACTN|nr:DUF6182 family protein [Actinomadura litoris]MUN39065.1 hypothetical protein [Actinomadura litoris]